MDVFSGILESTSNVKGVPYAVHQEVMPLSSVWCAPFPKSDKMPWAHASAWVWRLAGETVPAWLTMVQAFSHDLSKSR